jgi:hypothetical protein
LKSGSWDAGGIERRFFYFGKSIASSKNVSDQSKTSQRAGGRSLSHEDDKVPFVDTQQFPVLAKKASLLNMWTDSNGRTDTRQADDLQASLSILAVMAEMKEDQKPNPLYRFYM